MFLRRVCKRSNVISLKADTYPRGQFARGRNQCAAASRSMQVNFLDVLPPLKACRLSGSGDHKCNGNPKKGGCDAGDSHKGQHGRVHVIGGCSEFTGAPFFAAFSAMRAGADYGNVHCTKSAATVIKSYAPELIVHPYMIEESDLFPTWEEVDLFDEQKEKAVKQAVKHVERWLEKATCVIVGPGLGQDPIMWDTAARVIQAVRKRGLPLVLDADAISIVARDPSLVQGYPRAVLTPNVPELWRLADAVGVKHDNAQPWENQDFALGVAKALEGPVLVAKGQKDLVLTAEGVHPERLGPPGPIGCPKRCGGQGDVLSGILGTAVSWAINHSKRKELEARDEVSVIAEAAVQSLKMVRCAAHQAYGRVGRSMVASDIIDCLPETIDRQWPRGDR